MILYVLITLGNSGALKLMDIMVNRGSSLILVGLAFL